MENPINSISDKGDTKSLINECFAFCSALTGRDCKFSFTLRLGSSFTFSLASEQVAPTAKSRSPSYLRRQQRRRAALLEKRAQISPDKKASASKQCSRQKEDNNKQINDEVDINCPLNLDPNPARYPRHSEGSVETGDPDEGLEEGLEEETKMNEIKWARWVRENMTCALQCEGPTLQPLGWSNQGSECDQCQQVIAESEWRLHPTNCSNCWTKTAQRNSSYFYKLGKWKTYPDE